MLPVSTLNDCLENESQEIQWGRQVSETKDLSHWFCPKQRQAFCGVKKFSIFSQLRPGHCLAALSGRLVILGQWISFLSKAVNNNHNPSAHSLEELYDSKTQHWILSSYYCQHLFFTEECSNGLLPSSQSYSPVGQGQCCAIKWATYPCTPCMNRFAIGERQPEASLAIRLGRG